MAPKNIMQAGVKTQGRWRSGFARIALIF